MNWKLFRCDSRETTRIYPKSSIQAVYRGTDLWQCNKTGEKGKVWYSYRLKPDNEKIGNGKEGGGGNKCIIVHI